MLKGIIIGPDFELAKQLEQALLEVGHVGIVRKVESYPTPVELARILRAHAPELIFVNTEVLSLALDLVGHVEKSFPGIQLIGFNRNCEPHALLEAMRAGVREYLTVPFDRVVVGESVSRLANIADRRSPVFHSTDLLYAFLPAKPGVGSSTLALNASIALSRVPDCESLLMDLDLSSGVVRFLVKLDNTYSILDACEHAHRMDESLWPQMTSRFEKLDILHAGPLNPDIRIEPVQVRNLLEFARRHYRVICADLSGNLERYSFEMMNEAKRIFLVCTGEMSSLHLAREKYQYLKSKDLGDRVAVLMNRWHKRPQFGIEEIEEILGIPVFATFTNDYTGVQKSISNAKGLDASSELGKQMAALANSMLERRPEAVEVRGRRFIEYFNIVPARYSAEGRRTAG